MRTSRTETGKGRRRCLEFGRFRRWCTVVLVAMSLLAGSITVQAADPPDRAAIDELPVVELPAEGRPNDVLAIILSGDGGWADLDKVFGEAFQKQGLDTVGFDCLKYFWKTRQPEEVSQMLGTVLRYYLHAWNKKRVLLVGYSFGACWMPFLVNRLPADLLAQTQDIIGKVGKEQVKPKIEIDVKPGDVVLIRYEGPKGGPGFQEMLYPTSYLKSRHLGKDCALITDGRFSGGSSGLSIGHVSPEAAEGGAIGLVEEGDIIEIDIPRRSIQLRISDAELMQRRAAMEAKGDKAWQPVSRQRVVSKALQAYGLMASSASRGAVRDLSQLKRR